MRDGGRRFIRWVAVGAPLALVVAVATLAAGCGGDGNSAEVPQDQAQQRAATPPAGGQMGGAEAEPAGGAMAMAEQELPAGVTPAMIEEGKKIYGGAGICFSCHGPQGQGVPNLGANLTDGEWLHSDGSFKGIAATVTSGVPAEKSSSGVPMPPKGGSGITDEQVRAVAAYVWSLAHGGS